MLMGVKKMENVVLEKNAGLEKLEKVENGKVERKAENQNGQTKAKTLAELLEQRLEALNVDLSEIELLNTLVGEINVIETKIQKMNESKIQKINEAKSIYEKLSFEAKNILQILGLINIEEIEKTIDIKTQIAKTQTVRTTTKAEKGNGVTDKKIVFNGKTYNIASYFMKKMGISGGLRGLEEWARARGLSLKVEDDVIFIV
jgi:hypothetical protein